MKLRLAILQFGFALTGVVTTMLGPLLPLLSSSWQLSDAQAGRLFTAQFLSSVAGSLAGSYLVRRRGSQWTVCSGMSSIALGVLLLSIGSLPATVAGICFYGMGLGMAIPCTNLLIADLAGENKVAALSLLNFSWTAGALAAPMLITAAQHDLGLRRFLLILFAALAAVAVAEMLHVSAAESGTTHFTQGALSDARRLEFAVLTFLFLALYVGVENGYSGWLAALCIRLHQTPAATTAMIQSSYWGAILAGRLAAPLAARFLGQQRLMLGGLLLSAAAVALTVTSTQVALLETGVLLAGLGMAALFPTMVAIFAECCGTGPIGSIVIGTCGMGGAIVPALVGDLATYYQSLRMGFLVNLICLLICALLFQRMLRLLPQTRRAPEERAALAAVSGR